MVSNPISYTSFIPPSLPFQFPVLLIIFWCLRFIGTSYEWWTIRTDGYGWSSSSSPRSGA
jgi:hypothetical protein